VTNPSAPSGTPRKSEDYSENKKDVEIARSITGLGAVVAGDVAIAVAAIIALYEVANNATSSTAVVSILTSAFTAIGTMTTAYFGIRAASNTAQAVSNPRAGSTPRPETTADEPGS
jgi:hypothetical protein